MELNFSEADLNNSYQKFDYNNYERQTDVNAEKYWEKTPSNKQNTSTPSKKKKVSFDDILSNMNLVVNKSGVLQFMTPNQEQPPPLQQYSSQQYSSQQYSSQQYSSVQQQQPKPILVKKEPLDPSVKHSYIYNKYFKDYQDAAPVTPEMKVPKTKQEYLKMLIEERIRQNMERKRISQIKSTKLLFTTNVGNQGLVKASKNTLGKLNFR
jgi:hypothetical protein